MIAAPLPANEQERLEALRRYALIDTPPEIAFERMVRMVARIFAVPIAMVTVIDLERQWFKACVGVNLTGNTRELSFCSHTLLKPGVTVVPDAQLDPRFFDNPVVSEFGIRFYAGAPLITPDGHAIGTLCIYDDQPRPQGLSEAEQRTLEDLASATMDDIESRRMVSRALEAEQRVERLMGAQKRFVDDAAHELRAPLTAIRGTLEWVRSRPELPQDQRQDALHDALAEADRLERLVQDLLALARGENAPPLERIPLELGSLLREVHRDAQYLSDQHSFGLELHEVLWTLGHPDPLRQVLLILLENAVRHTPAGGQITVSLRCVQNRAELRVQDSGVGIPSEYLLRVFERFYRAPGSRERNPLGSGLGLPIARDLMRTLGGTLWLESEPGQGTVAFLHLPLYTPSPAVQNLEAR